MPRPTLIDISRQRADDMIVTLLDEVALVVPEIRVITAEILKKGQTEFTSLTRTKRHAAPFRTFNSGLEGTRSGYENRKHSCALLTPRFETDKALASLHPRGVAGGLSVNGLEVMTDSMAWLAAAFWYGKELVADAFPGVRQICPDSMVVDCGGNGAATYSEAYMIHIGPMGSEWVYGDGGGFTMGDPREETLLDASGKPYDGYVMSGQGFIGAMHRSPVTMVRIKGITDANPLTDAKLLEAYRKFRPGRLPNAIFTTMHGVGTLTASRATPEVKAPPLATDYNRIPIYMTEAIFTGASVDALPDFSTEVALKFKGET